MRKFTNRRLWFRSIPIWIVALVFIFMGGSAWASHHGAFMKAAQKWVDEEFQPSTLSKKEQMKEMEWFVLASEPFRGMNIKVVSETIPTHEYEAKTLATAFEEITGIEVTHRPDSGRRCHRKAADPMQSGENVYDAYVNDSDLIGTHARYGYVVPLSDFMAGEGADVTSPTLDLDDFIGISFHHRSGRQDLPAAGSAVCQSLLVPLRLVYQPRFASAI